MLRQLSIRDRLVIVAAVPLCAVAVVAIGLLIFIDSSGARPYGLFALTWLVVAGVVAGVVASSVLASIAELNESGDELALAHRKLAAGEITAGDLKPIVVGNGDELDRLAETLNAINVATVEISEAQQGAVKAGLSTIVVNLARRSQTLLDRQVEYLDQLESTEEDPERLGELFKVDHLATRMRRNAESLMVLAEADPGRRRGGPVDIADVLRVAMGEVEIYQHIVLKDIEPGQVGPNAAVDLAHLTAELMENATQFSPPNTEVVVNGRFQADDYVITIADQGLGLTPEKLSSTNELLANPPELGLGMGRSLGFMVVGRLAQRLKTNVTLRANDPTGSKAIITVPASLFVSRGTASKADDAGIADVDAGSNETASVPPLPASVPSPPPLPTPSSPPLPPIGRERPAVDRESSATDAALPPLEIQLPADDTESSSASGAADDQESWTPPQVSSAPMAKLEQALPSGDAFESGMASLLQKRESPTEDQNRRSLGGDDATSAGLIRRQRGASHVPVGEGRPVSAMKRNPEEVRSRLSRYRDGVKGTKPTDDDGQPTEETNRKDG